MPNAFFSNYREDYINKCYIIITLLPFKRFLMLPKKSGRDSFGKTEVQIAEVFWDLNCLPMLKHVP